MEKTYIIEWMPRLGALKRQSKKLFTREEAEDLAAELNEAHPEIVHEPRHLNFDLTSNPDIAVLHNELAIIQDINFTPADQFNLPIKEIA